MIVLDTNVVSGLMHARPDRAVLNWMDGYDIGRLFLTSVSVMEIQYGINLIDEGRRKRQLQSDFQTMIIKLFEDRILDLKVESALYAAALFAAQRKRGHNADICDIQIAGIAKANNAAVATRNIKDFEQCGITLINPWA